MNRIKKFLNWIFYDAAGWLFTISVLCVVDGLRFHEENCFYLGFSGIIIYILHLIFGRKKK